MTECYFFLSISGIPTNQKMKNSLSNSLDTLLTSIWYFFDKKLLLYDRTV